MHIHYNLVMKQTKRFINLEYIVDVKNYKESFDKWMKIRAQNNASNQQLQAQFFNRYLYVIKPIVHRFNQTIQKFCPQQYGLYTCSLNQKQIQIISLALTPLKNYQITTQANKDLVDNSEIQKTIQKKCDQIFRLNLKTKPNNQQLRWWTNVLRVQPISIEGIVEHGKGEGKKSLGMPTANIQIGADLQQKLDAYPNGVYLVDFDFVNGQSYRGAACLGTNPHYENLQQTRRIQVYVLHDFGDQQFYGSKVVVTLKTLIRFEGKFHSFDAFLQSMHNDIQIAQQISQTQQQNLKDKKN